MRRALHRWDSSPASAGVECELGAPRGVPPRTLQNLHRVYYVEAREERPLSPMSRRAPRARVIRGTRREDAVGDCASDCFRPTRDRARLFSFRSSATTARGSLTSRPHRPTMSSRSTRLRSPTRRRPSSRSCGRPATRSARSSLTTRAPRAARACSSPVTSSAARARPRWAAARPRSRAAGGDNASPAARRLSARLARRPPPQGVRTRRSERAAHARGGLARVAARRA